MTAYEFALSLENGLHNEIEDLLEKHSITTNTLLKIIYENQKNVIDLINAASRLQIDIAVFPSLDASLLNDATSWNAITDEYKSSFIIEELFIYWKINALIEKNAQFYQQAALNSPYPSEKIFFSSLAEIKYILKRRIQGVLQIMYNHIWGEIGFNPILFGKE